jgi:hypothetical protein
MSAVGVWHMIRRIRNNGGETRDIFEERALKITGLAFSFGKANSPYNSHGERKLA